RPAWMAFGRQAAWSLLGLLTIALVALAHAYALSDFSVRNVAENSHTMKPLIYKLTGVWGNHEGSMLLWVWMLALWGMCVAGGGRAAGGKRRRAMPAAFQARVLA